MRELWSELSESMRMLRRNAGMSLRQVEQASGRGRGVLSQVENGKARPNRQLVDWYDTRFGADGLLVSIYTEARTGHLADGEVRESRYDPVTGDAFEVTDTLVSSGQLVHGDASFAAGWNLKNVGGVVWGGRRLERIGARAGARLLASAADVVVPDCPVGEQVMVRAQLRAPHLPGTYVAYWRMVDRAGAACFPAVPYFAVLVIVPP